MLHPHSHIAGQLHHLSGLSSAQVKSALLRQRKHTCIQCASTASSIFLKQLLHPAVIIMFACGLLMAVNNSIHLPILLVFILFSGLFHFMTIFHSLQSQHNMPASFSPPVLVIRDASCLYMPACDLLNGDVVVCNIGDVVPATIKIQLTHALLVNTLSTASDQFLPAPNNTYIQNPMPACLSTGTVIKQGYCIGTVVNLQE